MGLAIFDGLVKQEAVFFFIACVAGLEKTPGRRDGLIDAHVLTAVDDFQLVAPPEAHLRGRNHIVLWRAGDPVNAVRKRMSAVGLDCNVSPAGMEGRDEPVRQEKRRFTAGDDGEERGIFRYCGDNLLRRHESAVLMGRVAERAAEIAARKAHEDGGSAGMVALALQGIEYFADLVLSHKSAQSCRNNLAGLRVANCMDATERHFQSRP